MREIRGEIRATLINTQLCRKLLAQPCCSMMQCKASMLDSVRMPMLRLKLFEGLARRRLRFHDTCLPDARVTLMPTCKKKIWIDIEEWERDSKEKPVCRQAAVTSHRLHAHETWSNHFLLLSRLIHLEEKEASTALRGEISNSELIKAITRRSMTTLYWQGDNCFPNWLHSFWGALRHQHTKSFSDFGAPYQQLLFMGLLYCECKM